MDQEASQNNLTITPEERSEARGQYADKLWRIQHLYKIRDKNKKLVNLSFNAIQNQILDRVRKQSKDFEQAIRSFDLKYRQGGVSTFWLLWWFDETVWNENTITGVLADKKENLGYLFEIVRLAYDTMPEDFKPELGEDSKSALSFPGINSKIFVSLSIKATALHHLHISEICYCKSDEIQRTLGACSPHTDITMESTGNGVGNYGYEHYQDGKLGVNDYATGFSPWFIQPEYAIPLNGAPPPEPDTEERKLIEMAKQDYNIEIKPEQILFRRSKKKDLKTLFPQEFPETDQDAFLTSGKMYFNARKVMALLDELKKWKAENKFYEVTDDYEIYEAPPTVDLKKKRDIYVAGADPADGGDDNSTFKIINVTQRREAMKFSAKCAIPTFYKALAKWCRAFNNPLLGVELNNHGHAVVLGLIEVERYTRLFMDDRETRLTTKHHMNGQNTGEKKRKYGWITSDQTRDILLSDLKLAIEDDDMTDVAHFMPDFSIFDSQLLSECLTFQENDGKYEAVAGKHDDDIFGTGIANQMYKRARKKLNHGDYDSTILAGESLESTRAAE